jgi:hypothetical protein
MHGVAAGAPDPASDAGAELQRVARPAERTIVHLQEPGDQSF